MPVVKRIWKGGLKTEMGMWKSKPVFSEVELAAGKKKTEISLLSVCVFRHCVLSYISGSGSCISVCYLGLPVLLQLHNLGWAGHGHRQALEQCHAVTSCCQWLIEKEVFSLTSAGMMISKCLRMKPVTQLRKPLRCELSAGRAGL